MAAVMSVSHGWLLLFLFLMATGLSCAEGRTRRSAVHRHLKRINKPAIKTIQSPDGDMIDCVHISHQPAFDHPFLRNHTIQMRPAFHPDGLFNLKEKEEEKEKLLLQHWHLNGRCPEGTVPIRRTREEDVLRAVSVRRYGRKRRRNAAAPDPLSMSLSTDMEMGSGGASGHQHAIAYVQGDKYYGARATINVWQPSIEQSSEFSLSQLWILGGSFGQDLNSIEAGWQVALYSAFLFLFY